MLGLEHPVEETDRTPRFQAMFAPFAGLDFELHGPRTLCAEFVRAARDRVAGGPTTGESAHAPKFAVDCHVEPLRAAPTAWEGGDSEGALPRVGIAWRWSECGGQVLTRFGHASVEQAGSRFSARLAVAADPRAPHFLLSGMSALVLHRLGGGILHAASVELDSGVIAFVGPSGAGKSTACRHVEGCPLFSADTLAVVPAPLVAAPGRPRLWFAHPLPGGTRPVPDMRAALPRWLPLRGILRVHRSSGEVRAVAASLASAVALSRESAFQMGVGVNAEEELLSRLEELARSVPVGRLHLQLGTSITPVLSRWLLARAPESACQAR